MIEPTSTGRQNMHVVATLKTGVKLAAFAALSTGLQEAYGDSLYVDSDGPGQIRILRRAPWHPITVIEPQDSEPVTSTMLLIPRPVRDQPRHERL